MKFGLQKLYINGGYIDATSSRTFETVNPANGEVLAQVQIASEADVDFAVQSAKKHKNAGKNDSSRTISHLLKAVALCVSVMMNWHYLKP